MVLRRQLPGHRTGREVWGMNGVGKGMKMENTIRAENMIKAPPSTLLISSTVYCLLYPLT